MGLLGQPPRKGVAVNLPPGVRASPKFGPAERVCSKKDFERLRKAGRRGGDPVLRVLVAENGLAFSRIASAVPRRYGNAVARNRFRRLFRSAFRLDKDSIPAGYDILLSPSKGARSPSLESVRASLMKCVKKVVARLERTKPPQSPGGDRA